MTDAERRDARLLQVFVTGIKHWSHVGSKETALRLHAAGYLHRSQAGRFYLIGPGERLLIAARRLEPVRHACAEQCIEHAPSIVPRDGRVTSPSCPA